MKLGKYYNNNAKKRYDMEKDSEKQCPECGEWFEDRELNNYGLCCDCETDLEIEHQQVIDTQNSLNNL